MDRIRNLLSLVKSQLWLVPLFIVLAAAGLAWLLLTMGDAFTSGDATAQWWLFSGEAATARDLLAALLAGLMTMTSLVVSITFVILTLSANQLGPRLIAIFMRDMQIQGVLGLFIGTILYVVLILRTLDDTLGSEGVPHLAITTGTALTILCLLALLFYLHKVARLIIADSVVEAVSRDLQHTFREILPSREDDENQQRPAPTIPRQKAWQVSLGKAGYLQVVDYESLVTLACERDIVIEVVVRAGHFLLRGGNHVTVRVATRPDEELERKIRKAFTIGEASTPAQDPEQGIRQLVEIATRALSPGTNDPFTALAVIDRLGASLEDAFELGSQRQYYRDEDDTVRVMANRADDAGMLRAAFHPIRQAGASHPAILISLADVIRKLAPAVRTASQQEALNDQLDRLAGTAALGVLAPQDDADIRARIVRARQAVIDSSTGR